jgi:hypothetical protein
MKVHMCVDIKGVLRWPDKKLAGMFTDKNGMSNQERMLETS